MVKTDSLKNVDYKNLSIEEQVYKLIYHYALTRPQIYSLLTNISSDAIEDFVSYAYTYVLSYMKRYDSNRGKLSTFIYSTLDYLYPIFIYQVKYNVSFYTARTMTNINVTSEHRERLLNLYNNNKQIDVCCDTIMTPYLSDSNGAGNEYEAIPDMSLADPDADVENLVLNGDEHNNQILNVFEEEVDKFVNRPGSKNAERNKDIIFRMSLREGKSDTLQTIASDYGLTRERVRQIYNKFTSWASKNNNLRTVLGLGRYEPEVKHRRNG